MASVNNSNDWTFIAVHRSRVRFLKKAVLVNGTNEKLKNVVNFSTSIPLVFKRKKEHEDMIFFSVPQDFEVKVRKTDLSNNTYSDIYLNEEQKTKFFKGLNKEI